VAHDLVERLERQVHDPPVKYASAALVKFTCIPSRRPKVSTASLISPSLRSFPM
jgi:hypothetical protein